MPIHMKARDSINHQIQRSLTFPTQLSAKLIVAVVLLWFVVGAPATSPLIYIFAVLALFVIVGAYIGLKHPVICPHCTRHLLGWSGFRLPKDYHFCPTCGASIDSEVEDAGKA